MIRVRFYTTHQDFRPVQWPVKHPYWCTGESGNSWVMVAYADNEAEILSLWPEAESLDAEECTEYQFTDRFPRPSWFNGT